MQFSIFNTYGVIFIASLAISLVACSKNTGEGTNSSASKNKVVLHSHAANECIDVVNHSHPKGKLKHKHHYHSCEKNNKNSNAHSHPSSSITGFTRHVHPNGSNEHTHIR